MAGSGPIGGNLRGNPPVQSLQDVQAQKTWGPPFGYTLALVGRRRKGAGYDEPRVATWTGISPGIPPFRLWCEPTYCQPNIAMPWVTGSFARQSGSSPILTLFNDDSPLISPEQWLLGLDHISHSEGKPGLTAKRTLQSACRCLAATLPDIDAIRVAPFSGLMEGQKVMTVLCKTHMAKFPLVRLERGIAQWQNWLTDFLRRMYETFPNNEQPNTLPAIVLVDEFDLHMRIRWQADAMSALSREFPNTQFIITAHSPLVVQATEGHAKLVVLRRKVRNDGKGEVLIDNDPRYAAGWRVDQMLASDLYGHFSPRSPVYTRRWRNAFNFFRRNR